MAVSWKDSKVVNIISTNGDANTIQITKFDGTVKSKPAVINNYAKNMIGVDVFDRKIETYSTHRRSVKWWRALFYYLLDLTISNANILYNSKLGKKMK